jgi:hypothetical protein
MKIEDKYPDVLQNIEFFVIQEYRKNSELTDYAAERVYEALLKFYTAELMKKEFKMPKIEKIEMNIFESVKGICEWRLGRENIGESNKEKIKQISLEDLILCFKRLIKSVKRWSKYMGRQGYLNYIDQFIK